MHTQGCHSAFTTSGFLGLFLRWAKTCLPQSSTRMSQPAATAPPLTRLASRGTRLLPLLHRRVLAIGPATAFAARDILVSTYRFTSRLLFTRVSSLGWRRRHTTCLTIPTLQTPAMTWRLVISVLSTLLLLPQAAHTVGLAAPPDELCF